MNNTSNISNKIWLSDYFLFIILNTIISIVLLIILKSDSFDFGLKELSFWVNTSDKDISIFNSNYYWIKILEYMDFIGFRNQIKEYNVLDKMRYCFFYNIQQYHRHV